MSGERIQKILSQAGFGSRREMELWVQNGWIKINNAVAKIGDCATADDKITVKGKAVNNPLTCQPGTRILLYHKPVGEISSRNDPKHTKTVFDHLPSAGRGRWVQVGRLDINTSGLMVFTNDGALANNLMHPRYGFEREYAVRVHGQVTEEALKNMLKGVELDDGIATFKKINFRGGEGANTWYHVVLTEGRNREVRRLWASQGVEVSRLSRIRFGKLTMPRSLARGRSYELTVKEVESFLKSIQYRAQKGSK